MNGPQAIAIGARKHGAKLQQNIEVTKLDLKNDGSWDIGTNQGTMNAGLVINAAGFWAKEIGKLSGLDLPLVPMQVGLKPNYFKKQCFFVIIFFT